MQIDGNILGLTFFRTINKSVLTNHLRKPTKILMMWQMVPKIFLCLFCHICWWNAMQCLDNCSMIIISDQRGLQVLNVILTWWLLMLRCLKCNGIMRNWYCVGYICNLITAENHYIYWLNHHFKIQNHPTSTRTIKVLDLRLLSVCT